MSNGRKKTWGRTEWDETVNPLALNVKHAWTDKWTSTLVMADSSLFPPLEGRNRGFKNGEHSLGD